MDNKRIMLSILKDGQIDCPQPLEETYFANLEDARSKGIELLHRFNADVFRVIKLTRGNGYYRTLGYFNKDNAYLR